MVAECYFTRDEASICPRDGQSEHQRSCVSRVPDEAPDGLCRFSLASIANRRVAFLGHPQIHHDHGPRMSARKVGASNYTFSKLVNHTMLLLTGYSTVPLRLASFVGFLFTILGGMILCYAVGRYLVERVCPCGFPFLAATISIFSGIQLFILGIIGEYLYGVCSIAASISPDVCGETEIGGQEWGRALAANTNMRRRFSLVRAFSLALLSRCVHSRRDVARRGRSGEASGSKPELRYPIRSLPTHGRSTSGTTIEPSACW